MAYCIAPSWAEKAGRKAVRPFLAAADVGVAKQFDRAQRARRRGHSAKLERAEKQWPQPVQHRPGPYGERWQICLVRVGLSLLASATLAASRSQPTETATAPSKSVPDCLASISAAPSLASRRTLSLTARASRNTASSSRASARRNMRPTARSNSATPSSVNLAEVSRTPGRMGWRRHCARSAVSNAPFTPWTG